VAGDAAQQAAQLIAFGLLAVVAEVGRRHLVRFIADHDVPIGHAQLRLQRLIPADLIEADDQQIVLAEGVARP